MSLHLDPEVERIVRERAAAEGMSVDDLLARTFAVQRDATNAEKHVQMLLARWRAEDIGGAVSPHAGPANETPSSVLFERWRELDAAMTEEEREAEDRLWEEVEQGINNTRSLLGMRRLSG